ncbi:hypothetical protein KQX54_004743 [Cotesia glomerata]|uniref:Uncharacterized protein n=1 Tax=Cotesia glomerata TaxID=32391 RepID=A0AAV7ITJ2_COTGL|nr:hypothetical protein KQX54_004743 [Cotesia glomerata]
MEDCSVGRSLGLGMELRLEIAVNERSSLRKRKIKRKPRNGNYEAKETLRESTDGRSLTPLERKEKQQGQNLDAIGVVSPGKRVKGWSGSSRVDATCTSGS